MEFDYLNLIGAVFAVALAIGGVWLAYDYLTPASTVDGTPIDQIFRGNLDVKTSENDFVTGGSHTSSNAKLYAYQYDPMSEADGVTISSSAKTIEVQEGGWLWFSIHNEDDGYLIAPWMESTFKNQNPRVKEIYYKDLDNDDKKEMIAKAWFGDIKIGAEDPEFTLNINWVDEDVALTDDDPSDQTSLGTTSGTAFSQTWKISGFGAGDGCVIGKIYFVTNDTREGEDIRLEDLRLFGDITIKGKASWSAPVDISASAYEATYYSPTEYTDPFNGILVYREPQATDALYVSVSGKLYLETSNNITLDMYLILVGGDGTTVQVTDSVTLSA